MSSSFWDGAYRADRKIWGEHPSEVARAVLNYLDRERIPTAGKRMLDIGCGYGRDALFLSARWRVRTLGVDPSEQAIEMARASRGEKTNRDVEFRCARFQDTAGEFDLVYAANLYQILPAEERKQFCLAAPKLLAPEGWLLLGTLSIRDPEHAGKGTAVPGDLNSWVDKTYVHLSPREELETSFSFLEIRGLFEQEYLEPRAGGETHHHISWILIGRRES